MIILLIKIFGSKDSKKTLYLFYCLENYEKVFLKIDIEGDEYEILNDIKKSSEKIIFLVIEFHDLHKNIHKIKKFLKGLDLKIIHIHANNYGGIDDYGNPKVIELSLLNTKKIRVNNVISKKKYPIVNLDYKNFKRRNEIKIKFNE